MGKKPKADLPNGFTEIQVEMPEDLYSEALAAAKAQGCSLDELVAELIQQEIRRRAPESPAGRMTLFADDEADASEIGMERGKEMEE